MYVCILSEILLKIKGMDIQNISKVIAQRMERAVVGLVTEISWQQLLQSSLLYNILDPILL